MNEARKKTINASGNPISASGSGDKSEFGSDSTLSQESLESFVRLYAEKVEESIKRLDNFDTTVKDLSTKIENSKLTIIETLGIFVALFTFISTEFQVFRSYRDPWAISGLSLILLGSISFLMILFDFYILQARAIGSNSKSIDRSKSLVFGVMERIRSHPIRFSLGLSTVFFIGLGILFFINSPMEEIKEEVRKNIEIQTKPLEASVHEQRALITEAVKSSEGDKNRIENLERRLDSIMLCTRDFGFSSKCFK